MPSLHSAGIRVRLGTFPLEQTLTRNIVLKKGEIAAQQCEEADVQLRKSDFLDEERVPFPGDDEGFAMAWLAGAPFLQVVTEDAFKGAGDESMGTGGRGPLESGRAQDVPSERSFGMSTRSGRAVSLAATGSKENTPDSSDGLPLSRPPTRTFPHTPLTINPAHLHLTPETSHSLPDTETNPKALVLHVMLTDKTFYQSMYEGTPQHIKIDVFFNGQLSSCVLIHRNDVRAGVKSMHQIFAGYRVDYMIERPWVILPPGVQVDGTRSGVKTINVRNRWEEICNALMREVNARGINASGERPPSAQYLKELASMQMPFPVTGMQKPGGRSFGVVDVVVTAGMGKKVANGGGYLKTPMRLVDKHYSCKLDETAERNREKGQERGLVDVGSGQSRAEGVMQVDEQDEHLPDLDAECGVYLDHATSATSIPIPPAHPFSFPVPSPVFHNHFNGTPLQNLSPSGVDIYSIYHPPSSAMKATSKGLSSSLPRKRVYSERMSSAIDNHTRAEEVMQARIAHQTFPSAHAPTSVRRHFKPPTKAVPEFNLSPYDGSAPVNPYQLPFSGMMAGLGVPGMAGLTTFDAPSSSPVGDQAYGQLTLPSLHQPEPSHMRRDQSVSALFASSPFMTSDVPPNQARKVSFGQANIASYNPGAPPNVTPTDLSLSAQASYSLPGSVYGSSPLMQRSISLQGPQPYFHSNSFIHQSSYRPTGPDPPIGFFKATTKPKTSTTIERGLIDAAQPRPGILVRRLSITGKDGVLIVDQQWETPQRIVATRGRTRSSNLSNIFTKSRCESPGSSEYVKSSAGTHRRHGTVSTMASPPPTSPIKTTVASNTAMDMKKMKRDSVHDTQALYIPTEPHRSLPALDPKTPAETPTPVQSSNTRGSRSATASASSKRLVEVVATRRSASNCILGVQGPKANTFVFDDPEELLRCKGLKSRSHSRSVSPTKVDALAFESCAELMKDVGVVEAEKVVHIGGFDTGSSSPLSSPPASPEMGPTEGKRGMEEVAELSLEPEVSAASAASSSLPLAALPPQSSPPLLPTGPDSPSRAGQEAAPTIFVASSPKSTALAMPPPSTPASTQTASSFKKSKPKAARYRLGPRDRPPRSPDRVSTVDNPPLNQNCVIQFAQSQVDEMKGAPLRQVKCERQGVFAEESVVVGMRFFVSG